MFSINTKRDATLLHPSKTSSDFPNVTLSL